MAIDKGNILYGIEENENDSRNSQKFIFFDKMPEIHDEYGNIHYIPENSEIARGGQGAVYRTQDEDIAIKRPIDNNGNFVLESNNRELYQHIRSLPLPKGIHISLPIANLRDVPGYVMKLLKGMQSFAVFSMNGEQRSKISYDSLPEWLSQADDKNAAKLAHYANTGSTLRRLYALYKSAVILARLHSAGIVYGDISPNNVFIGENIPCDCWFIDADNLRIEHRSSKSPSYYTLAFGAPEIVQRKDVSRPRSDCWSFAVMAFQILTLCHPFIGKMVVSEPDEDTGWDSEPSKDDVPSDLDEQAYAGYFPFIDDNSDDSNICTDGLYPRELVLTPQLRRLFQETFGAGRLFPHRRPSMVFWALELARAVDNSIVCPNCQMSYYNTPDFEKCPYCQSLRPPFAIARTSRWQKLLYSNGNNTFQALLPHRLFNTFSLSSGDDTEYEVEIDFKNQYYMPVRGTKPLPSDLIVEFAIPRK